LDLAFVCIIMAKILTIYLGSRARAEIDDDASHKNDQSE